MTNGAFLKGVLMNVFKKFPVRFLFIGVTLFSCGKNPVSSGQADISEMQKKVAAISIDVAAIRGMSFIRPVHVGVITKAQYASLTSQSISSSVSSTEEAAMSKEYAQMGFLAESDTPLNTILTDFYASFPAAYYTPGTDSLTIITGNDYTDFELNEVIAHELTHALQDQQLNTNLSIFPGYSSYNSDADLAQRSLLDGDAMFTEYAYLFKTYYSPHAISLFDSSLMVAREYKTDILNATDTLGNPVFLSVKNYVPYYLGFDYAGETYHRGGGWSAVNNLYSVSSAPHSSAEINGLSPISVRYFDFHAIQNLLVSQPGNMEFADDDNAGFALLLGLFYGDLDVERAGRSLDWRGDRYTYVKRSGQAYGTLVWSMAFANEDAAQYMFGKLVKKIGSRRLARTTATMDSTTDTSGSGIVYTFKSTSATTKLKRAGDQIWWLENTDTLTGRITDILQAQKSAPALAKAGRVSSFPTSLSPATKKRVIEIIMNHVFKRR
jgi:hypothetical protein